MDGKTILLIAAVLFWLILAVVFVRLMFHDLTYNSEGKK